MQPFHPIYQPADNARPHCPAVGSSPIRIPVDDLVFAADVAGMQVWLLAWHDYERTQNGSAANSIARENAQDQSNRNYVNSNRTNALTLERTNLRRTHKRANFVRNL